MILEVPSNLVLLSLLSCHTALTLMFHHVTLDWKICALSVHPSALAPRAQQQQDGELGNMSGRKDRKNHLVGSFCIGD